MSSLPHEILTVDFCVVGGGIAGLCAAVAAARHGLAVALVHNRSVLGGNASSEIRQHIGGACFTGHYPDAREGGIVGEVWGAIRRKGGGPSVNDYAESSYVLLDFCWREPNLRLVMNTHVDEVNMEGRRIRSIGGTQSTTGLRFTVLAPQFADCSGDAHLAFLAGCRFFTGQEGRAQFAESLAPAEPRQLTMGNTILFQAEETKTEVAFEKPDWAPDLSALDIYWNLHPPLTPLTYGSWTFEYGGQLDTVRDAEQIHAELVKIVYAAWADLRNRFPDELARHRLSFISSLPGKRESRRVVGDHVLTQNDIVETRRFPDDVTYAGWSLDLHNPEGFYGKERPTTFYFFPEIHSIPLRCLYAADTDNLWLAGRDISVTHIALGGARLMASCGLQGEAIGIAASFAVAERLSCLETCKSQIGPIQQAILRDGGYIPGVPNRDEDDLARRATVSATGAATLDPGAIESWDRIGAGVGVAMPIVSGRLDALEIPVRNPLDEKVEMRAILQPNRYRRDFHPTAVVAERTILVPPGQSWAHFDFGWDLTPDLWMIHLFATEPSLEIGQTSQRVTGVHAADHFPDGKPEEFARQLGLPDPPRWVRRFNSERVASPESFHRTPCFRVTPPQAAYAAENVVNGISRPERLPNLWISGEILPQTIRLAWPEPVMIGEARIVFDDDMDLPMPHREVSPTLVRDYELHGIGAGSSTLLAEVSNNRLRLAVHRFAETPISALELKILSTHGIPQARVCEIRCYRGS